jgi:TonB-linked SusC/RagA family outer membrane protein
MKKNNSSMRPHLFTACVIKWLFLFILVTGAAADTAYAQQPADQGRRVTGNVTDEKDAPLPGASVTIKGTRLTSLTDADGNFSIVFRTAADSLSVSHTGYKTKTVSVKDAGKLAIKMEPGSSELNDVVIVGYGVQKKVSVTGAISTVKVSDLQEVATPSLSNAIGGRLPGIVTRQSSGEPGYDAASVYIRGFGTFGTSDRSPLILVDGVERSMDNINVQEVESFSILKDASATAVYGVRGANGVVLINTKRGVEGKPKVTFRTETAVLTALRLPKYINSYEYGILANEATANSGLPDFYSQDDLQKYKDHSDPYLHPDVDWVDVVLKKKTMQSINNLSLTGGNKTFKYFTNIGYTEQGGIYKEDPSVPYHTNSNLKRYNFRSNVDVSLTNNLTLYLNLGGITQNLLTPGTNAAAIFDAIRWTPNNAYPVKNPNGSIPGMGTFLAENPFTKTTQKGYTTEFRNTIQSSLGPKWDLSKLVTQGLSLQGLFAYDYYGLIDNIRPQSPTTYQYLGKDASGADQYKLIQTATPLGYSTYYDANRAYYLQTSVNYDRSFGKHKIGALVLANRREYVDLSGANSLANIPQRSQGLAGRVTYDFDSRYLLESNVGYNGSENFAPGKRYGLFPSVSGGWIISHEKFWNSKVISLLKLRGSYGEVGNDQIGGSRFLFLTTINTNATNYLFGSSQTNTTGAFAESLIGNPDVTWERALKSNAGLDLELWRGKVVLQVDAYSEHRTNILLARQQIPISAGYIAGTIPYANLGIVNNHGIDGSLQLRNTTKSGFYYSFQGNFTFARNKILEDDSPIKPFPYQNSRGQEMDRNYGYEAIGLFKDQADIDKSPSQTALQSVIRPGDIKYKDLNGDGVIDNNDQTFIGYPRTPEIMYGFGGTIAYKGFDLSIFFTGTANTSLFLNGRSIWAFRDGVGNYNVMQEYYDHRWIPGADNSRAEYPSVLNVYNTNNYVTNTLYVKNANYLRLKSAELGYTLSQHVVRRLGIGSIRAFVNGANLAIWDHLKVVNPENDDGEGTYPLQSSLNFGVQVNF